MIQRSANAPITRFLIVVNVIAYVWEIYVSGPGMLSLGGAANMQRVLEAGSLYPAAVLQDGQWWRIVTAAFLHGGLLHIGVNMMSLWFLGRFIEYVMGSWRTLVVYVVSMIVSGLGIIYFSAPNVPTLGASGAIFGLFGALFAIGFKLGKPGMDLVKANLGILILNLIITFTVPAISWQAHVSGLIAGFILSYLIYFPPRRVRPTVVDARTGTELESEYQSKDQARDPFR
jgi:membrane associated rhomboid family serine protease